jgi:hypothetical protein
LKDRGVDPVGLYPSRDAQTILRDPGKVVAVVRERVPPALG